MIRLYMHDKAFDQLLNLPKTTQKKVLEFQKKFRENPKSPAIHLEPIGTFKDPYLRTARIDLKYRAIVKVPEEGNDYYLLWVDNHDEAMAWAENKVFEWNSNTESIQIFSAPNVTYVVEEVKVKKLFDDYSDTQLIKIGVPPLSMPLVRSVIDLNDLEKSEKNLPSETFEHLFNLADGASYEALINEIEEGKTNSQLVADQLLSANNKRHFVQVNDELLEEILNGELSKWQIFLHPSQRKLVEGNFSGSVKVSGGGGTGKTIAAIHRLKHLAPFLNADKKPILFTTYTNALTKNLRTLIEKLKVEPSKYVLLNIDQVARQLATEAGIVSADCKILNIDTNSISLWNTILENEASEFDTEFLKAEYEQVILFNNISTLDEYIRQSRLGRGKAITRKQRIDIWNLIERYESLKKNQNAVDRLELFNKMHNYLKGLPNKPFTHVIADEIQDFSNVEVRLLRALVDEKPNDLFLVGDPYQNIYARKVNFTQAGVNVRGAKSKKLKINYRTSEEIKRFAINTVKGVQFENFDGENDNLDGYLSLFHGDKPGYNVFKTKAEELEFINTSISNWIEKGFKYSDIVIGCRMKEEIKEIKNNLHNAAIPYYDITTSSGDISGIHLCTLHSLKGLEFKCVVVADANQRTFPFLIPNYHSLSDFEKQERLRAEKSLLYVAFTRAIHNLLVTGTGSKSSLIPTSTESPDGMISSQVEAK